MLEFSAVVNAAAVDWCTGILSQEMQILSACWMVSAYARALSWEQEDGSRSGKRQTRPPPPFWRIDVGVLEHDHGRLSAELEHYRLQMLTRQHRDPVAALMIASCGVTGSWRWTWDSSKDAYGR